MPATPCPEAEQSLSLQSINPSRPSPAIPDRRTGDFVRVSVRDTGCGMSLDAMDRLFEPFFTTRGRGKAVGLGLPVSHKIIAEAGGWIEVQSEPSRGTCAHVFLPRADASADPGVTLSIGARNPSAMLEGNETILIADDDFMIRNLMRAVLGYRGYKIIEVSDGKEAIDKVVSQDEQIDMAILDVEMPIVDGWAALADIHAAKPALPVILCSGNSSEQFDAEAKAAGALLVLPKPFTNLDLLRRVRETLDAAKQSPPPQGA